MDERNTRVEGPPGRTADGLPDTRGTGEKIADALTGDNLDDKTGQPINRYSDAERYDTDDLSTDMEPDVTLTGGIQTGGTAKDGTPDTRGIMEKVADAITGDRTDDKTGKEVR